jgi:hypothetical protein
MAKHDTYLPVKLKNQLTSFATWVTRFELLVRDARLEYSSIQVLNGVAKNADNDGVSNYLLLVQTQSL